MFTRILTIAFLFLFIAKASAQTDSTHYDMGRIQIKKEFTQSITIKASDLERYQFSDLADAINVWLYGTYTNSSALIYVVNGNIITDVNAYSIYDIDEITLVQNSSAQVSGAAPGAQMVLIKLKTNRPGKQGVEVAGQTSLVNSRNTGGSDLKSTNNFYHQYYLAGYKNYTNASFGVSADYQHDVSPYLTNAAFSTLNALHFDRFKFNAYADAKLWSGTSLNFNVNYVPQTNAVSFSNMGATPAQPASETANNASVRHMISSAVTLNSNIAKDLNNTLSGAYNHYNYFENDSLYEQASFGGPPNTNLFRTFGYINTSNFLLRDNLGYHARLGAVDIEPSANFSYRDFRSTNTETSTFLNQANGSAFPNVGTSRQESEDKFKLYLLTPSLNIYYKDIINLQGGFVSLLNQGKDFNPTFQVPRLYPFVTTSAAIINPSEGGDVELRLFGSFARQNTLLDDQYAILAGIGSVIINNTFVQPAGGMATVIYTPTQANPYHQYNNYQAGLTLKLFKNLSINYSYSYNESQDLEPVVTPSGTNGSIIAYTYYIDQISTHRVGFDYSFHTTNFKWRMGLNIAQSEVEPAFSPGASYSAYLSNGHRYSGGFNNRVTGNSFFAGLDVLYQLGERPLTLVSFYPYSTGASYNVNSFSIQSFYAGSKIKIKGVSYAEVYVNTRNILQNKTSDITDNRRFYGFGFKLGFE